MLIPCTLSYLKINHLSIYCRSHITAIRFHCVCKLCIFAYIHGGITFDPVPDLEEVATWCICMPFHFWSSWISPRNHDHVTSNCSKNHFWSISKLFELDRKCVFEQIEFTWSLTVRKSTFDPVRTIWRWIKSDFSNSLKSRDPYFEEKFDCIKSELACICVTWLPLPKLGSGSKVRPSCRTTVDILRTLDCNWCINFDSMHVISFIINCCYIHFAVWPYLRTICEIGDWSVLCGIQWIIRSNPLVVHQTIIHWTNLFFEFLVKKTDLGFIINVTQSYISS